MEWNVGCVCKHESRGGTARANGDGHANTKATSIECRINCLVFIMIKNANSIIIQTFP